MLNKRTYLDPIHQDIVLSRSSPAERLVMDLIDTKEFQRLRRVHQLGATFFTFQGAEGSRFTHSVGVMHVASRFVNLVKEKTPSIEEKRPLIMAAALLHDIGHGPFSHVTERILHYDHEDWSCKIITGSSEVRQLLDSFDSRLADDIVNVLKKKYYPKYLSHIISSQLDCDRFDYLLRDSYMTGTAYGLFALHRILSSMEIDEPGDRIIVVGDKGQTAVEDYLFARYSMYAQVYYHRKNLAARALLAMLVKRAQNMMAMGKSPSFMDEVTAKWLGGVALSVDQYLTLDDIQLTYHIKRWSTDPDKILADLASRFLHRRLFKAARIYPEKSRNNTPTNAREGTLELKIDKNAVAPRALKAVATRSPNLQAAAVEIEARKICQSAGFDPDYYITTESTGFRPYDYYRPDAAQPQTNIVVKADTGEVNELSRLSLAVEALVKGNYESNWLIYPAEVHDKISSIVDLHVRGSS